ncbi:two-component system, chemotaxis family, sensor kinase CheA [Candidatus Magnetomoraceae bacterium gMMP-13]
MSFINDDIISEFIEESREHIISMESDLLKIEKNGSVISSDIINCVFRAIHSIKGASGMLGFDSLMKLTHSMENILMRFRDGRMTPDSEGIDALLTALDKVNYMINDIHGSNDVPCEDEITRLNAMLTEKEKCESIKPSEVNELSESELSESEPEPEEPEPEPEESKSNRLKQEQEGLKISQNEDIISIEVRGIDNFTYEIKKERILSALSDEKFIYAIWLYNNKDLKEKERTQEEVLNDLKSLGDCLFSDFDMLDSLKNNRVFHLFIITILEQDLFKTELNIPFDQIKLIDNKKIQIFDKEQDTSNNKSKQLSIPQSNISSTKIKVLSKKSKSDYSSPATIRVDINIIDKLMNLAGELVLGRNQLRQIISESLFEKSRLLNIIQTIDLTTCEIQEHIMQIRMQPISTVFNKFYRVIRNISRTLSKDVEIIIKGGDVELDKSILENLSDPLTHLIRNCMAHGIESPEERIKKYKESRGKIYMRAFHEGSQVNIIVSDDGRGIDIKNLVKKAIKNNLINFEVAAGMTHKEKLNLIFLPGFSITSAVSDISGRGVGMDVVKTNIEKLGGHVEIESIQGKGTDIYIRLPLTLSIIPSLVVKTEEYYFAIPQVNVKELVSIKAQDAADRLEKIGNSTVLRLREKLLPLICLAETLEIVQKEKNKINYKSFINMTQSEKNLLKQREETIYMNIVVLRMDMNIFGLIVDELFDNEEIVVKPLSRHIKNCKCFSGATIMGDGRVAMILDIAGIADHASLQFDEIIIEEQYRREQNLYDKKNEHDKNQSFLLFTNALDEYFALPLSFISRLEKINLSNIKKMGNGEFVNHNGSGLPVFRFESFMPVGALPDIEEFCLIIPKITDFKVGFIVSNIINTIEIEDNIEKDTSIKKGLLGSRFINGYLTFFIDPDEVFKFLKKEIDL